ncbi:hypothetical protein AY599_19535 [Leptolyngbya valderiana BDU 20041]|nr:hypothetical protein AY599_19535 [Leptolyngbya valderiana BDU 20041]
MSSISANQPVADHQPAHLQDPALREENITLEPSRVGLVWKGLAGLGVLGIVIAIIGAFVLAGPTSTHAAILHVKGILLIGTLSVLGFSLGSLFFIMINAVGAAGWHVTMKRVLEQAAALIWLPVLGVVLFAISEIISVSSDHVGVVSSWLTPDIVDEEYFITKKGAYFDPVFVGARMAFYVLVWVGLSRLVWSISRKQERTGDRWLTNKLAFHSAWGLVVMALATAFFSFDWLMALTDYKFFSTMWGVYFFAGTLFVTFPAMALLLTFLRSKGKMQGLITEEHHHDLSKFMFGFIVFWGYIAYSQYFLIWYSQIPEETTWFMFRKTEWPGLTMFLVFGHFLVPLVLMFPRAMRRTALGYGTVATWLLFMHVVDLYWIIRPSLGVTLENPVGFMQGLWVDIAGIGGVVALYTGVLIWRLTKAPLVNRMEPRMPEALGHKNYI